MIRFVRQIAPPSPCACRTVQNWWHSRRAPSCSTRKSTSRWRLRPRVLVSRIDHRFRRHKTVLLRLQAAIYHPLEDAGPLGLEFLWKLTISLLLLDDDIERDQMQTPTDGLIDASQARPVIAGNQRLEDRLEREEILPHEPGANPAPPVSALIFDSAHWRPISVLIAVTRRAPRRPARSVGCRSAVLAMNVSMGAPWSRSRS